MSLDEHLQYQQQRKTVIRRLPSAEALAQVESGNKFIVVEEDFDPNFIPKGYTLINMKHKGTSFKTLVLQSLLFYMANLGEGDPEGALEEIADFYGEAKDFEDDLIQNGHTSVQDSNWATLSRGSYHTYLINRLVKSKDGESDGDGELIPEFNQEVLGQLDLTDPYVNERVRGIAAVALGKSVEELKEYGIRGLLKHVKVGQVQETRKIDNGEFRKVTQMKFKPHWDSHTKTMRCLADSHYYLLPEYENDPNWDYDLRTMTKTNKKVQNIESEVFDVRIAELEKEIIEYRRKKHGELGRHDSTLTRQYINLSLIAPENPQAQLDITPPERVGEK